MAEKGPFLTSCIIFYLSIGAAIFQILEEPNWQSARDRYTLQKENIVKKYKCLTKEDLDEILEVRVRLGSCVLDFYFTRETFKSFVRGGGIYLGPIAGEITRV